MASVFERMKNVILADIHEILDEKEKKNPIAMLNQYLRECEKETEKVRKLVERQYLLKDEFTREYHHALEMAEKRKKQSEIAERAGEAELFEFAQSEHMQYAERAARLKEAKEKAEEQLVQLERKYEELKHKLKDMQLKRMELMGRENIARAQYRMNKWLENPAYSETPFRRFAEIERYLERLEYQVNSDYFRHTIDAKIAQLEKRLKNEESL